MATDVVPVAGGAIRVETTYLAGDPAKPASVFVHGIAQNGTVGRQLVEFFHSLGHPAITVDLPGHGGSDSFPEPGVSMKRFGETIWDVLSHWLVTSPILGCGHSAGGMVLLEAALQHPERIAGLLLISTSDAQPIRANDAVDLRPMVEMMIQDSERMFVERRRVDFGAQPEMGEEEVYSLGMMHTETRGIRQVFQAAETYDVRGELDRLTMPCVIMRGEDDLVISAEISERMRQGLGQAKVVTAPGRHNWFLQRPDVLRRHLEEQYRFLMSNGAPSDDREPADGRP